MDENDWLENSKKQLALEERERLNEHAETIKSFEAHWTKLGFDPTEITFEYVQTIGVLAKYPDIVSCLTPEIIRDKEGLVDCESLYRLYTKKDINPGYLYSKSHIVMLSPLFRRKFGDTGNWAPRFVELFWEISEKNITSHISLDFDRVQINTDGLGYFEEDSWFGAPFNKDISSISDGTSKLRPPLDIDERICSVLFNDAYALDIYWYTDGSIKTFQALELQSDKVKIEVDGVEYFPARYIHAEFDMDQGCFRHFDGAVQHFSPDEYYEIRDSDFKHDVKEDTHIKAESTKAFKFNGIVSVEMWQQFCLHFCSGNPLIYEYFYRTYPGNLNENIEKLRANRDEK